MTSKQVYNLNRENQEKVYKAQQLLINRTGELETLTWMALYGCDASRRNERGGLAFIFCTAPGW